MRTTCWIAAIFLSSCVSAPNADVTDHWLRTSDGTMLAYDVRGHGAPTLVFVHCWAGERAFWREQLDEFAAEHQVVALDLAGHGGSQAHSKVSLDVLARDLVAVVDDVRAERCILVGHSLGGPVSLRAAPLLAGRVLGVIGVETMHDVEIDLPREQVETMLAAFELDFEGAMRSAVRAMLPIKTPHELVAWITTRACAARPDALLAISRALLGTDLPALLGGAGVPVRCINSAARPPFVQETSLEHNRRHADFDAVLIEGTGHFPQLERPREFNQRLRACIEELAARR